MYFTMFLLAMFAETTSHSLVYSLQTKSERLCWWDQEAAEWELKSSWNSQDQIESYRILEQREWIENLKFNLHLEL